MKLIGSMTEQAYRKELMRTHAALFNHPEGSLKLRLLQKYFAHLVTAYSLHWIPGQGEDIVTYLINANLVAIVETDRYDASIEPIIETMSLTQYMIGLSKSHRIKLAVALDMARKDMGLNQS